MSQTLKTLRELLLQYSRANGVGSIKIANAMVPEIINLVVDYIDESTGKTEQFASEDAEDDLVWFVDRLAQCEKRYGEDSPQCSKLKRQKELLEDGLLVSKVANSPERQVFNIDVGGMSSEQEKAIVGSIKNEIRSRSISMDMSNMTDEQQAAYIEAQYRVQGIKNNGAKYMGEESLVQEYVDHITNGPKAETCAPCTVNPATGLSAIDAADAAYNPVTLVEDHFFSTTAPDADIAKIFKAEKPAAPKDEKKPTAAKATKKTVSRAAPKRTPKK